MGKSGVSYPVFLRVAEERGLFKAMEGTVVVRDVILEEIEFAKQSFLPLHVKMHEEKLAAFDVLAARSSLGIPDSFEFGLVRQKIDGGTNRRSSAGRNASTAGRNYSIWYMTGRIRSVLSRVMTNAGPICAA